MKYIAYSGIGLVLSLGLLGLPAGAQNQAPANSQGSDSSLGTYARQVRKDPGAKPKKVFDNDNLPTDDKLSIVGPAAAATAPPASTEAKPGEQAAAPATTSEAKAPGETRAPGDVKPGAEVKPPSDRPATKTESDEATKQAATKQWGDKLAAQKDQIDLLTRELNVLQREYQIRAAAMYADAGNRMRNSTDWDKQDAQYKQQIADKQKELDDAKQKLEDMQEEARKAGVPNSVSEQ